MMTRDYLSTRIVLSRCCVLIDCSRGLCRDDVGLIGYLTKMNVPWQIILTKADLFDCDKLATSISVIEHELIDRYQIGTELLWNNKNDEIKQLNDSCINKVSHRLVIPVSSSTGAGVSDLWNELLTCARDTSIQYDTPPPELKESDPDYKKTNELESVIKNISKSKLSMSEPIRDIRVKEHIKAQLLRMNAFKKQQVKKSN